MLERIMGDVPVRKIDAKAIRDYQDKRRAEGVSGRTVNLEVTLIRQVLKRAKRWSVIADDVANLPESQTVVGRVLTLEQKRLLFQTAASKPEWEVAYCAAVVAVNTTCRKVEVLNLRWAEVDLFEGVVSIRRSKTEAGHRSIPLNREALAAFAKLRQRAEAFGGGGPEHPVFPACESGQIDLSRPQVGFRTAWRSLVKAAGRKAGEVAAEAAKASGADPEDARKRAAKPFSGFRFHDLRHQSITELAEAGISDAAMQSIAGHMSRKMLDHYSHVRMAAKREAVQALGGGLIESPIPVEQAQGKAN